MCCYFISLLVWGFGCTQLQIHHGLKCSVVVVFVEFVVKLTQIALKLADRIKTRPMHGGFVPMWNCDCSHVLRAWNRMGCDRGLGAVGGCMLWAPAWEVFLWVPVASLPGACRESEVCLLWYRGFGQFSACWDSSTIAPKNNVSSGASGAWKGNCRVSSRDSPGPHFNGVKSNHLLSKFKDANHHDISIGLCTR